MSDDGGYIDYSGVGRKAAAADGSTFGGESTFETAENGPPSRAGSRRSTGGGASSSASRSVDGGSRRGSRAERDVTESGMSENMSSDRSTIRARNHAPAADGFSDRFDGPGHGQRGGLNGTRSPLSEGTEMDQTETSVPRSFGKGTPRSDATFDSQPPDYNNRSFYWDHVTPLYGNPTFLTRILLEFQQAASFGITLFSFNFLLVFAFARYIAWNVNPLHKWPQKPKVEKDWWNRITGERFSGRLEYYAEFWGYECEQHDVETEDGFVIRVHHLLSAKHRIRGHPVILQHGILCNSLNWVVNEERSIAFWLLEQGYDVWLSNIRINFKQPHRKYGRWDPRYWAWSFKEIGLYDCVAIVNYVYDVTGSKVAYVGHSQGGGTMFLALSRGVRPEIGEKMSCFIAMGPAVYAGPILKTFPFSIMRMFTSRQVWSLIFGVREFFPVLSLAQEYLPGWLFGYVAFVVFQFLFNFTDTNWVPRQIPKFFRSVPMANSSELLFYYMASFSHRECIFQEVEGEPWFGKTFPPLAVFWGTADTLVSGAPLIQRLRDHEPNVSLHREVVLQGHEHLDMLWHVNVIPDVCIPMREIIEETRSGIEV